MASPSLPARPARQFKWVARGCPADRKSVAASAWLAGGVLLPATEAYAHGGSIVVKAPAMVPAVVAVLTTPWLLRAAVRAWLTPLKHRSRLGRWLSWQVPLAAWSAVAAWLLRPELSESDLQLCTVQWGVVAASAAVWWLSKAPTDNG